MGNNFGALKHALTENFVVLNFNQSTYFYLKNNLIRETNKLTKNQEYNASIQRLRDDENNGKNGNTKTKQNKTR